MADSSHASRLDEADKLLRDGAPIGFRTMTIEERIKDALQRIRDGNYMRIPAHQTDPDIVLADCLTLLERMRSEKASRNAVQQDAPERVAESVRSLEEGGCGSPASNGVLAGAASSDKYGALKRLHEAVRRLAPQFKTQFAPQAWDDIPSAEKDCVAAALEEVFPSAEKRSEPSKEQRQAISDLLLTMRDKMARGEEINWLAMPHEIWRVLGLTNSHEGSIPYIDRSEAVNLARNVVPSAPDYRPGEHQITPKGIRCLAEAVLKMDEAIRCAGSAKQHAVGFEKWMSYQLYYEQNTGSFKTDSQRYYTADQMRAAWEAGATGNLEEVARYFETRYAHVNDSKWIAKEIRDLMRSPESTNK